MRAPASGREALAHAEPGQVYLDRETGEEMEPVAMVLPLAPTASSLPRTPRTSALAAAATNSSASTSATASTAGSDKKLFNS